ncbi:MAG: tetratricopeptide repeat protein [Bacteroidota bacterium]
MTRWGHRGRPLAPEAQTPPSTPVPNPEEAPSERPPSEQAEKEAAQQRREAAPFRAPQPERTQSTRQVLDLARRLIESGQTDRAVVVLEDLYAENPGTSAVWSRLLDAYKAARRFDEALAHIDARIEAEGPNAYVVALRASTLFASGDPDGATAAWAEAIALAPEAAQTYRTVANSQTGLRLYAEAAATLTAGAVQLDDDEAFVLERAHLWGLGGDYRESARLYLTVLGDDETAARNVQNQLARLSESSGALEGFRAAVDSAVAGDPFNAAFREMAAWVALEQEDYDSALDATRAADRLQRGDGRAVFRFAEAALAGGALDAADAALDDVLDRQGDGPLVAPALLYRARIAEARAEASGERPSTGEPTPLYDRARDAYVQFAADYPQSPDTPEALRRLADLYLDVYLAPDRAEVTLNQLIASTFDAATVGQARLDLGRVALQRGDLFDARDRFVSVEEQIRIGPLAEQARYELALIDFYEGYLFSALARAEAMDDNTAADVANDAVSLRLTLDENAGQDSTQNALRLYGRAALLHRRGLHADALATLDSLDVLDAKDPLRPLGDESLILRAHVLRASGDARASLGVLGRLPQEHPRSYFLDRALFAEAEIYERDLLDPSAALDAYGRLLDLYPGSLLAPRARERLRDLRQRPGT